MSSTKNSRGLIAKAANEMMEYFSMQTEVFSLI